MDERTIWMRGRPVRGAIFGLIAGLGIFLLMSKFELVVIDTLPLLVALGGGLVLGIVRGMIGRPYRASVERSDAPPPAAPEAAPPG